MNSLTTNRFFSNISPSVHGGVDALELARLGFDPAEVIDFSANQSPLGPSPLVQEAIAKAEIEHYPDRNAGSLAEVIAQYHGLAADQVIVGNGSTELIRLVAQLALRPGDRALALSNTFGEYQVATELAGAEYNTTTEMTEGLARVRPKVCWWCLPNNPTGITAVPAEVASLVRDHRETLFVLDEAYCDLLPEPQWTPELLESGNLLILRSMTKAWGLAGLRLGYALGSAALMMPLCEAKAPWNVNACAQAAGIAAIADIAHYSATIALLKEQKEFLVNGLQQRGWAVMPSAAAFFLVRVGDAAAVKLGLLAQQCLVRDCTSFGLPEYIRISPRLPEQNRQLLAAFDALNPEGRP